MQYLRWFLAGGLATAALLWFVAAAHAGQGADESVNYSKENLKERLKSLTGGSGADVVLDLVGGPYTEPAFRAIARGGRYLVVGFAPVADAREVHA